MTGRVVALALVTALAVGGAGAPAGAAAAEKPRATKKRCEVVVFKRRGKTVRRCRLERAATPVPPRAPGAAPTPAGGGAHPGPAAAPLPPAPVNQPEAPAEPPWPQQQQPPPAEPPADPWFLTLYARDVGNGDFRLTPAVGDIPAGRLVLSYKNVDFGEHDLWLRHVEPARADTQLFPRSSSQELRRTELTLAAGRYTFLCSLPGHEQMRQDVRVTG